MKTKIILVLIALLFSSYNADAQLLKKLKKALDGSESVEEEEVDKKRSKKKKKSSSKNNDAELAKFLEDVPTSPDNNVQLPDNYNFSYRATIQITTNNKTVEPVFYIQPNASYYARKNSNEEYTEYLVLDNERSLVVLFGEFVGEKMRLHNYMSLETKARLVGAFKDLPRKSPPKELGSKTILDYPCNGHQITTEAGTTEIWVTDKAPASIFTSLFETRATDTTSPFSKNSMIMEASYTSINNPEKNFRMVCTALQPEELVLKTADYKGSL